MRRRFVTLLEELCIQGIIDLFWLAFKGTFQGLNLHRIIISQPHRK